MHLTIIFFNCTLYYIGKINITGENFFFRWPANREMESIWFGPGEN